MVVVEAAAVGLEDEEELVDYEPIDGWAAVLVVVVAAVVAVVAVAAVAAGDGVIELEAHVSSGGWAAAVQAVAQLASLGGGAEGPGAYASIGGLAAAVVVAAESVVAVCESYGLN